MINVSIIGGSGYVGGELVRLLLMHSKVKISQISSERYKGKLISFVHPNLKNRTELKFCGINDLVSADLVFVALPHLELMNRLKDLKKLFKKMIDLSADFRLNDEKDYLKWYGVSHKCPEFLNDFVYGIVELHRERIRSSDFVSSAGCNATATILSLFPLIKNGLVDLNLPIVSEAKCGSSQGGNKPNLSSHHPERSGSVRSYKPTNHRHIAEMIQELGVMVNFSATAIEMVRGILVTSNVFLKKGISELDVWKAYRKEYGNELFIRFVKNKTGVHRYPEPKILSGTNYCDIGFELSENRLVVISAIDNLMKGASGQAVQAMNLMFNFNESEGLDFSGLHPI